MSLLVRSHLLALGVVFALTLAHRDVAAQERSVTEEIRHLVESLRDGRAVRGAEVRIAPDPLLAQLYEERAFAPIWTPRHATQLLAAVDSVGADGLEPQHYHRDALAGLTFDGATERARAEADLLHSAVLVRLARDLRLGRVDPATLERGWNIDRRDGAITTSLVRSIAESNDVAAALSSLRPSHFVYAGLRRALAEYRAIAARGGWWPMPRGPTLALDSVHDNVAGLRRRLMIEGDLSPHADSMSTHFDARLDSAVRRFQHRHSLNEDGIVGPATRRALDVPVNARIEQIRLNLERARWVLHGLADTFVAVNVAGQRVYFVRGGDVVWESRSIVGAAYTRTPIFTAPMRYIVLNPTWTVPTSINHEILAAIRRSSSYLSRQNMSVVDGAGRVVPPGTLNFSRWSGRDFPYVFRQEPGDLNALGRIKFMFPNPYNVYLHDTPARTLFEREVRTFSHGCVRVQNPLELAVLLLNDAEQWSREDLQVAIATGETQTVNLPAPIPTLVLYWTASADLHGEVHFYGDPYGRDAPLQRALNSSALVSGNP